MDNQIYTLFTKIYPFIMLGLTGLLIFYMYKKRDYIFTNGFKLIRKGEYKQALDEFIKYSAQNQNSASIRFGMAHCYFMLGFNNNAINNYEKSVELNRNLGESYLQLALLFSMGRNFEKALGFINQLYKNQKKFLTFDRLNKFRITEILGWIYHEKGELDNSLKYYKYSIPRYNIFLRTSYFRYSEKFSPVYYRIGIIFKIKGEIEKAKEYFENSIKSSSNSIFAEKSRNEIEKLNKESGKKIPFSDLV